jgi:acyl-CoA synthetase (AMP-forming)/AMP-acid ligase II
MISGNGSYTNKFFQLGNPVDGSLSLDFKLKCWGKMIIPDYVEKNAKLYPNKTAVVFEDRRCSFEELKGRVYRLANALLELGIRKGDRVAILQDNCFEYSEIFLAVGKIGGVVTPLNYRLIGSELVFLINHAEANTLIVGKNFVDRIAPVISELGTVKRYICLGDKPEGMMDYDQLISSAPDKPPEVEVGMEDLFCLAYTGGTTGRPKGAMLTHRNLHCACNSAIVEEEIPRGVGMLVTPLFHVGSIWPLFYNFMLANTVVILRAVDARLMLEMAAREKVNFAMWIAPIINFVLNYPDLEKYDLSSLDLIICGGAPLSPSQLKRLVELLGCRVHYGGGQTEVGVVVSAKVEEQLKNEPETIGAGGRETYDFELRVVDEQGNDVPPGGVGELCVRSEAVMKGYWNLTEEIADGIRDGWKHTGDLVRIDEKGYVYYVDRKKDMIKTGGENVYSKEVEDAIVEHPAVAEVAVIGIPDEKWGEMVTALVVLREGQAATEEEIVSHCKKRLAGFKCPKSVEFYESFPKTGIGKVAKNVLREKYWKGFEKRVH